MKITRMKNSYSFIGNYLMLLNNNSQRIKNMMLDYKLDTKTEKLPDGKEVTNLFFTKGNIQVRFLGFRIDFDYLYLNQECTMQKSLKAACDFFKLLGEIFDAKGARIAIVSTIFTDNENQKASTYLSEKFGVSQVFGPCNEFTFRINNIKQSFETLNSVLEFRPGQAKNNKTGEVHNVMIANIDINTLISNKEHRFDPINAEEYFSDLLMEEQEKINILYEL